MKRALITGCSSGIGRAVTHALLDDGWHVVGISRRRPGLTHEAFIWQPTDLRARWRLYRLGTPVLDALVHCAAVRPRGDFQTMLASVWLDTVQTNLLGTYRVVRAALPYLERSEDGRILLFSGGGAFNPQPDYSAYAVSKAGVVSMMETLAAELSNNCAITVNCVSPGYVPTPMHGLVDQDSPEMERAVACVLHLLSPSAKGLTGKTISAEYDGWQQISQETVPFLNASKMGTRERHKVWPMEADGTYVYRTDGNLRSEVLV